MKIVNNNLAHYPITLYEAAPGDLVEFERGFHQKHAGNAKFLVLKVPAEYIRADKRNKDDLWRIMVANVATGDVSLITTERMVRKVVATVVIHA